MSKNLKFQDFKENKLFWQEEVVYCIVNVKLVNGTWLLAAIQYCSPSLSIYYY